MNHKNVTSMYIILVVDFFFVHHSSRALINYKKKHKAKVQVEKKEESLFLLLTWSMMNVLLDSLLALKFFDYASLFLRGENFSSQKDMCVCSSSSLDTLVKITFFKVCIWNEVGNCYSGTVFKIVLTSHDIMPKA